MHSLTDAVMADLSELGHPARVISVFKADSLPSPPESPTVAVYLHRMSDPGNVGTVIRAVATLGGSLVRLSQGCADPLAGKGVRASMGAVFHVPLEIGARLPTQGRTIGADHDCRDADLGRRSDRAGDVGGGCRARRPAVRDRGGLQRRGRRFRRPPHADSLNAASAATVALYEIARQRAIQTESASSSAGGRRSNQP